MPKPSSWCSNESWHCTHDSSSLCTRHCAFVLSIRHHIWVGFPYLYAQGIVPLCQATSLHKAFPPHATVGKGRLHSTPCRCNLELHTITCHGAHLWLLARLAHVPCSCLRTCTKAPKCGHAHATSSPLSHPHPHPLKRAFEALLINSRKSRKFHFHLESPFWRFL